MIYFYVWVHIPQQHLVPTSPSHNYIYKWISWGLISRPKLQQLSLHESFQFNHHGPWGSLCTGSTHQGTLLLEAHILAFCGLLKLGCLKKEPLRFFFQSHLSEVLLVACRYASDSIHFPQNHESWRIIGNEPLVRVVVITNTLLQINSLSQIDPYIIYQINSNKIKQIMIVVFMIQFGIPCIWLDINRIS